MAELDKEKELNYSVHTTEKQVFRSETALVGVVATLQVTSRVTLDT